MAELPDAGRGDVMPAHSGGPPTTSPDQPGKRLESWKEIAGYLNRHVTTVRRWERHEALPVHRHRHAKLGSIYAYTNELDSWFESRRHDDAAPEGATASIRPEMPERLTPPPALAARGATSVA